MSLTRLLVFFGGMTVEHEVSIITGVQLINHVDRTRYQVTPVYIDKTGHWWTGENLTNVAFYQATDLTNPRGLTPFTLSLNFGDNPYDAAILCFHGAYGEAGKMQGVLDIAGIPYQGPGVIGSAACFDKIMLRQILKAEGIPQPEFVWFSKVEWQHDQVAVTERIASLGWPVFVKPANGGSTIGIEKVTEPEALSETVARVLQYDDRVIVEAAVENCLEINVSVLGVDDEIQASVPEQPIKADEYLSFADKYERGGGKKSGMASATRRIPAPISSSLTAKLQSLAKQVFQVLDCSGVIRIDFFVDPSTEEMKVIEPNTIPGSMSYYLWEASGLPYAQLIDRLVAIALHRQATEQQLTTTFESNILQKAQTSS